MASEPKVGEVRTSDQLIYYVCIGNDFVPCSREQSARLSAELSAAREMRAYLKEKQRLLGPTGWHCKECGKATPNKEDPCEVPDCRLARLIGGDRG